DVLRDLLALLGAELADLAVVRRDLALDRGAAHVGVLRLGHRDRRRRTARASGEQRHGGGGGDDLGNHTTVPFAVRVAAASVLALAGATAGPPPRGRVGRSGWLSYFTPREGAQEVFFR